MAVSVGYLVTYYSGASLVHAQSVAFVTWLLGHVLLAFNLRPERQPLAQLGAFSNQVMTVWAAAAIVLALSATNVPALQAAFKVTALGAGDWLLVLVAAVVGTFWIEALKLFKRQPVEQGYTGPKRPVRT